MRTVSVLFARKKQHLFHPAGLRSLRRNPQRPHMAGGDSSCLPSTMRTMGQTGTLRNAKPLGGSARSVRSRRRSTLGRRLGTSRRFPPLAGLRPASARPARQPRRVYPRDRSAMVRAPRNKAHMALRVRDRPGRRAGNSVHSRVSHAQRCNQAARAQSLARAIARRPRINSIGPRRLAHQPRTKGGTPCPDPVKPSPKN